MKDKIVFIIYSKFHIYIFRLYFRLTTFLYWIISLLLIANLNQYFNYEQYLISNTKLAFNINIIYLSITKDKNPKIKRIEFEGFNNTLIQSIFQNCPKIFKNENLNYNSVSRTIDYFKSSGFIHKIKLSMITVDNIKYLVLNIKINPLLKKIRIIKYKKLQIPKYLLNNFFKKQIGLPQNYTNINSSIKKIYLWYKKRGFEWVNIKLIKGKNLEYINLTIFEGLIVNSSLLCEQKKNVPTNIIRQIEARIINELTIIPGCILNMKKLELGINYLKEIKLIADCRYKVIQNTDGLNINLKYDLFKDNEFYLYKKNMLLDYYVPILHTNKLTVNNTINSFSNYNMKKLIKILSEEIIKLNLIIKSIFFLNLKDLNMRIIPLYQHFGFKYFTFQKNKDQNQRSLTTDIQMIKQLPIIDIIISYPNIQINQNLFGHLVFDLYYKLQQLNILYPLEAIKIASFDTRKSNINHSLFNSKGIQISFKHNLYHHINLIEQLKIEYKSLKEYYINLQNRYNNTYKLCALYKKIKQKLIFLNIKIKYNTFYLTNQLKSGTLFIIELISFTSLPFPKFNIKNFTKYSGQNLYLKYNQIFILPQMMPFIHMDKNALIFFSELNWFIGGENYLPIFQENHKKFNNTYCQLYSYKKQSKSVSPLFLYHLEYNTSTQSYYSLYIFCCFTNNLYKQTDFTNFIKYYALDNLYNYEINIGSGIQFNMPIRIIPPLRIEYSIRNKAEQFFQLRAYSKYIEHNAYL